MKTFKYLLDTSIVSFATPDLLAASGTAKNYVR